MNSIIQITEKLKKELDTKKRYKNQKYEDVIWDLIEDTQEINEKTKKELEKARDEIRQGKVHCLINKKIR